MSRADRQFLNWTFESAVVIVLATIAGKWLDAWRGTGAKYLSVFLLLGFALEGYNLYKIIKSVWDK